MFRDHDFFQMTLTSSIKYQTPCDGIARTAIRLAPMMRYTYRRKYRSRFSTLIPHFEESQLTNSAKCQETSKDEIISYEVLAGAAAYKVRVPLSTPTFSRLHFTSLPHLTNYYHRQEKSMMSTVATTASLNLSPNSRNSSKDLQ